MVRSIFRRTKSNNGSLDFENRPTLGGLSSAHDEGLKTKNQKTALRWFQQIGLVLVVTQLIPFRNHPKTVVDLPGVVCK